MDGIRRSDRISVSMCTYNGARYLSEQLDSIARQTVQPFELVVCDDGSTDATLSILEAFRQSVSFPVRISVNPVNLGSTRNFERALQLASGDFIALCDQDDIWLQNKLEILSNVLRGDEALGGAFSDADIIDESGFSVGQKTLWTLYGFTGRKQKKFEQNRAIELLLKHDIVTGATLMVRASLRPRWEPIPVSWVHDGWITWMLVLNSKLAVVPQPLIRYRIHAQQQLGIGTSQREKREEVRRGERARYSRVSDQFEDLRERMSGNEFSYREVCIALERKIALLRERAHFPEKRLARVFRILAATPAYLKYARGWRSMRKDLFLS